MSRYNKESWDKLVETMKADIPGFEVGYKDESKLQKVIAKISFWNKYEDYITTMYPKVYFPNREYVETHLPVPTLEHEWVHLKDQKTFFGLLPKLPAWLNMTLFSLLYISPQIFALGAVLAVFSPWWLLCLLFLAPLPAPGRAWAEVRAYRRSLEHGSDIERIADAYVGAGYYFMWPFRKHVLKWLDAKPSPYVLEMDTYIAKD